uniref:Cytochrome P450 monooxygenase n=1 Tax=Pieris rapae TaxID=64459 RepID=A0A1V0D9F8_PIERA|nr:cytochrome P450 monooxygenase [Pieris rapae]
MFGVLVAIVILLYFVKHFYDEAYKRHENFPPGPVKLPVYGGYWIILSKAYKDLGLATMRLAKEFNTKVVGLYLGECPQVIVNDPALVKEVLLREEFDGRMDTILGRARSGWKKLGLFFTDGFFWHTQRRFSLRYMRDAGFGRRCEHLEDAMTQDFKELLDMVKNGPKNEEERKIVNGDLIYLPHFFDITFLNGMIYVFTKSRLPREKYPILWEIGRNSVRFQRSSNDLGGALVITPWLKNILPKWCGYHDAVEGTNTIKGIFREIIREAIETYDESHERHFIDAYIKRMKQELKEKNRTTYSVEQLEMMCTDYAFPSGSGTEMVLTFLVERMLIQGEIQDKIHEEIDRVVGPDRLPTLDDRCNLPYTEACLREIMRTDTLVPLGIGHRSVTETKLDGYTIPENTSVSVSLVSLNSAKSVWGDPENFRPERFIKNGKLDVSLDKSLPFGAGRRLCAGETFARQGMFLTMAMFMHSFHVSTVDGKPLKDRSERIQGLITTRPEFWVRVTPRNQLVS